MRHTFWECKKKWIMELWKEATTLGRNISPSSLLIFKNYERFGIAIQFPKFWDVADCCSLNRLEVMNKNVSFLIGCRAETNRAQSLEGYNHWVPAKTLQEHAETHRSIQCGAGVHTKYWAWLMAMFNELNIMNLFIPKLVILYL